MKRIAMCLLVLAVLTDAGGVAGGRVARPVPTIPETAVDAGRIDALLTDMTEADLDALPALTLQPFVLPAAGADVMRVQLSETYTIKGVGRDTVQLRGWIAVKHGTPRPAPGESEVRWGTALSATEFVGLHLRGDSALFGPVEITLDPTVPSAGEVGKLETPFLARVGLDLAYRKYRDASLGEMGAPEYALPQAAQPPPSKPTGSQAAVRQVITGVLESISRKDSAGMLKYYSKRTDAVFFNTAPAVGRTKVQGASAYINGVAKMFENIRTIKVQPNDDMKVTVAGALAVAALTGKNDVVDNEGKRGVGSWRWSVQLARENNQWLIVHDHLSFFDDPATPVEVRTPAGKCLANISIAVNMPRLDLQMRTQYPVQWYSEVTTIPPVGHTASVSLTPTPMVSGNRVVAMLEHGAVNFREVVRHVPLERGSIASQQP